MYEQKEVYLYSQRTSIIKFNIWQNIDTTFHSHMGGVVIYIYIHIALHKDRPHVTYISKQNELHFYFIFQ